MMKPTGARRRQEGDDAPRRHPKRVQRSTELPTVGAAALQQQQQAWTEYARVELRALQTREPAALAQLLIRLDRHGCELRVVRRYCEVVKSTAGQRGPRGWVAEAGAIPRLPYRASASGQRPTCFGTHMSVSIFFHLFSIFWLFSGSGNIHKGGH